MNVFRVAVFALALAGVAHARPIVVEESATLAPPDQGWPDFGKHAVAIDGDFALVSAVRYVADPAAESGVRVEAAALLYKRSGAAWNHVGQLGPVATAKQWTTIGLAMKGGVAMTFFDGPRIFERSGSTWAEATIAPGVAATLTGPDIEIDGGRILAPRVACNYEAAVLRKINGAWDLEGVLPGNANYCGPIGAALDLHLGRVIVHNPEAPLGAEPYRVRLYRLNPDGTWQQNMMTTPPTGAGYSSPVAINWPYYAVMGNEWTGASVGFADGTPEGAWSPFGLQPVDALRAPHDYWFPLLEHVGANLFAQHNYSVDREAGVIHLFRVNDDALHSNTQVATLQTRNGASLGSNLDYSGNRIIVSGGRISSGDNTVRVFDLAASLESPPVQVHDFESPSAGALWQPTAGSKFSLATSGNTHVYRQALTPTLSASFLPEVQLNQAIQAQITLTGTDGADRWAGLVTRRSDDSNYYYVTLRASGSVQLRRMVNGTFSTLATANVPVTIGRTYQLRLESIGTLHKVYLDDRPLLSARDSGLGAGSAGVMAYRASADYDNVVVTPSPFTTIYSVATTSDFDVDAWNPWTGNWTFASDGVLQQNSTQGIAKMITGAITEDQIVRARIRPTGFAAPGTWVGLVARYLDDGNYLYATLRSDGVVSLWRRNNGAITQLATRRMPVSTGQWYDLRIEVLNDVTRVLVDSRVMLSSTADPGPTAPGREEQKSQVGMITNRATADFDDFLAYQP